MKELERRTGVNRETIRVMLRKGLLPEPQRPKPNVAIYGEEHVERILAIRKLQKGQRLSLESIKQALEGKPSPYVVDARTFPDLIRLLGERAGYDEASLPLSVTARRNPKAKKDMALLQAIGAINVVKRGGKKYLSHIDAEIVNLWGDLRAAGFTEEFGFTAEFCKLHVDSARKLAHEELKIVLKNLYGKRLGSTATELGQAAFDHLLNIFGLIRIKTILSDLQNLSNAEEA